MLGMFPIMARYTSTIFPVKKVVNLTAEQAKRIRDYRFAQQIDSENETIREAGLKVRQVDEVSGGSPPGSGSTRKPASPGKTTAPGAKKPTASDRQATAAQTKEAQIRALREQGAG